jgi:hypothetical protein
VTCLAEGFVEEMDVALMVEEAKESFEMVRCVHCGGSGRIGTFCDRCVDSGCIYVRELYDNEGIGYYWEE